MGRTSDARERLVQSARELLATRGFNAVGVSELCDRADVRKGSFYYFFPSKQELAVVAIRSQWEAHAVELARIARSQVGPLDRIRRYLRLHHEASHRCYSATHKVDGCPFANLSLELSSSEPAIRAELERTFAAWTDRLAELVAAAIEAGEVPEADPHRRAEDLLAYLEGTILLARTRNQPDMFTRLEAGAMRLLGCPPTTL